MPIVGASCSSREAYGWGLVVNVLICDISIARSVECRCGLQLQENLVEELILNLSSRGVDLFESLVISLTVVKICEKIAEHCSEFVGKF
jgi:hypothetical protein